MKYINLAASLIFLLIFMSYEVKPYYINGYLFFAVVFFIEYLITHILDRIQEHNSFLKP